MTNVLLTFNVRTVTVELDEAWHLPCGRPINIVNACAVIFMYNRPG